MFPHFPHHRNHHNQLLSPQILIFLSYLDSSKRRFWSRICSEIQDIIYNYIYCTARLDMAGTAAVHGGDAALNQTPKRKFSSDDHAFDSMVSSVSSKSSLGSTAMLCFGGDGGVKRLGFQSFDQEELGDEYFDEYYNQPEKKRRLTVDQIHFLEKSFLADNKLEPERKIQLAKELSLEPRQIAVWFQNRRARWKSRQLETDYETLHASYKSLKVNYDSLLKENERLKAKVLHLKCDGIAKDVNEAPHAMPREAIARILSESEEFDVSALVFKNEEDSLSKSDVTNVESPRLTNGIHSCVLDSHQLSRVFGPDHSDLSRNGEDDLFEEMLLPDCIFSTIEDARYHTPVSSFYYGFPVEDHAFGFWSS